MSKRITLIPSYGRDYKNKKDLIADFMADKDFTICDMSNPYDGKQANKSELKGYTCQIRYKQLTQVTVINN